MLIAGCNITVPNGASPKYLSVGMVKNRMLLGGSTAL